MGYMLSAGYAEVYEAFLAYEQLRVSSQGYESIKQAARKVLQWFEQEEIALEDATIRDCLRCRDETAAQMKKDGTPLSAGSVQNRIKAGRVLFRYLVDSGRRRTNPFREVKNLRVPSQPSRNVLSELQMSALLDRLKNFDQSGTTPARLAAYRLHVIAEFLYATGLRIAEAASLVPANIDTSARLVYVPEGKGQKARMAFMTGFAADVMEQYLKRGRPAVLRDYERIDHDALFGAGHQWLTVTVNAGLREICAGMKLPLITSHGFRHSLGTHLLRAGCDMRYIQAILGHERLATTQIYTRVEKDDLKKSLDAYHPRQWVKP